MTTLSTTTLVRPAPPVTLPNGLAWKPYVYGGTDRDVLTAFMDEEDDGPLRASLAPHGSPGAIRRHHRLKTPLCDACHEGQKQRAAERYAQTVVYALHAAAGDGTPRCATRGAREVAAPGQEITCGRCKAIRGKG